MERKIGEIFEYNGEWYQCVESQDGSCKYCDMDFEKCPIPINECTERGRSDKSYVIFKKLEKVGEPYRRWLSPFNNVMVQRYRLYGRNVIMPDEPIMLLEPNYKNSVEIEIKQTKENMGDNDDIRPYDELFSPGAVSNTKYLAKEDMEDLDKIKVRDYTKVEELNVMEEKKLNLKPFDIQKAREGKPVCTRDGRKARIICFDAEGNKPLIVLSKIGGKEVILRYTEKGQSDNFHSPTPREDDLMMLPEKKEGWVNVYKGIDGITFSKHPYPSKEEAIKSAGIMSNRIDTVKICWEE